MEDRRKAPGAGRRGHSGTMKAQVHRGVAETELVPFLARHPAEHRMRLAVGDALSMRSIAFSSIGDAFGGARSRGNERAGIAAAA